MNKFCRTIFIVLFYFKKAVNYVSQLSFVNLNLGVIPHKSMKMHNCKKCRNKMVTETTFIMEDKLIKFESESGRCHKSRFVSHCAILVFV